MAVSKSNKKKQSYISVPSQIINPISSASLESLLLSPKKKSGHQSHGFSSRFRFCWKSPRFWLFLVSVFGFFGMMRIFFDFDPVVPFLRNPCSNVEDKSLLSMSSVSATQLSAVENEVKMVGSMDTVRDGDEVNVDEESEFWKQPDGLGYRPCLEFTREYRRTSVDVVKDRTKYLMVVVSGGMNQQRNQIVDAVVIARILGAALVVPILQVNVIWGDESEFADIFDLEHFKKVLENDVRIVSSLPSTHVMTRPVEEKMTRLYASPQWIRSRYHRKIRREGVLLLRSLDSRLSKDLPSDLQKLRCKVAFHALRFAPPILELGNKLTERMRSKGPYLALHLRMEKDVWVRTGCLPGLTQEYDEMINNERIERPELLTSRSNMTFHERKLAGLCPLNALEVAR
ncbi:OLC1v1001633C1 [Oldenlandia corymbosa var. corymbosa]|nr:OLC1v1001633C1 [Oldenlandia corymbosa var. corymbosa]